jgi:hypothetical protein
MAFFKSKPEKIQRISKLRPEQESLFSQYLQALGGQGAGGAFGDVADYYRGLMSGEGSEAFEAPLMRQFQEDIMPGIAEQFAGLGAGGLSSGGFAQETGRAATDLSERLAQLRAGLRSEGVKGLQGLTGQAFGQMDETLFRPREPGLLEKFAGEAFGGIGKGLGTAFGGPLSGLFSSFLKK